MSLPLLPQRLLRSRARPNPVVRIDNLAEPGKSYVSRHSSQDESMPMDGNCAFWGILRHLKKELTDANLLRLRGDYLAVCRDSKLRAYFSGYDDGVWAALIDRLTLPDDWKSTPGSVLDPDKWFSTLLAPIVAFCEKRPFAQLDKLRGPRWQRPRARDATRQWLRLREGDLEGQRSRTPPSTAPRARQARGGRLGANRRQFGAAREHGRGRRGNHAPLQRHQPLRRLLA